MKRLLLVLALLPMLAHAELLIDVVGGSPTPEKVTVPQAVASRTGLSSLDAPRNTQVLQPGIERQAPRTMFDVMNVSGVTANSNLAGNRSNYMFRGYNIDDNNGTKVNGQYNLTWADIDMRLIDHVEVLKGPSAAMYGKGDPAGFVNIVTKKPEFRPEASLFVDTGNRNYRGFSLDATGALGETTAARVIASYSKGDLVPAGAHKERFSIAPSVRHVFDSGAAITLDLRHATDKQNLGVAGQLMAIGDRPAKVPFDLNLSSPNDVFDVVDDSIGYRFTTQLSDEVRLNQSAKFQSVWRSRRYLNPQSVNEATGKYTAQYYWNDSRKTITSADVNVIYSAPFFGLKNTLVVGADVVNAHSTGTDYSTSAKWTTNIYAPDYSKFAWPSALKVASSESTQITKGVYVEDSLYLTDRLIANAGLRYDSSKQSAPTSGKTVAYEITDNALSPNVGLTYKLTPSMSAFVAYSRSFMPQSPSNNGTYAPPQKTEQKEAGLKYETQDVTVSGSVYRLTMSNVATPNPADVTQTIYVGERETSGFELDSSIRLTKALRATFAYAYTDSQITKDNLDKTGASAQGNQFANVPRHNANAWLMYEEGAWGVGVGARGQTSRFGDNANSFSLPGYVVVDASAFYNVTRDFRLQAVVRNVFDKNYYAGSNSRYNIMQGQPLTIGVSAEYRM